MSDPLDSARYLLARARDHAADLDTRISAFFSVNPYRVIQETDRETGEHLVKFKLSKPFPKDIGGVTAEALVGLRHALDHAGFAFAKVADDNRPFTSFPFCDHPNELAGRNTNGPSREIPPEIFAVMAAFKPYKGGDDLLWCLNKMANANKHQFIRPVGAANAGTMMNIRIDSVTPGTVMPHSWDSEKNELIFARIPSDGHLTITGNVALTTLIVFDKVPVVEGQEVRAVLKALSSKVESIINAIELEARRLGLIPPPLTA